MSQVEPSVEECTKLVIKWSGNEYTLDSLADSDSIADVKAQIYSLTGVKPERQKLLGLKTKTGKAHLR